ncbi:ribose 5-phosphate isomerase B [Zavarzinia sp. CC-PAN008]|uniref:ribose 5-phosphate isomerase B n=1 Tax=Zavarzinia sp. CC-PAN008 TaxID=3243332 RepID=UPI003F742924
MAETIALASDHAGVALKDALRQDLEARGFSVLDLGTNSAESVDYPDFAHALAAAIGDGRVARGIAICGTGIGMSIAANRHDGVRAALVHDRATAELCRQHNDANVLVLGARNTEEAMARACLDAFLETPFEGGRHARRVAKLSTSA